MLHRRLEKWNIGIVGLKIVKMCYPSFQYSNIPSFQD